MRFRLMTMAFILSLAGPAWAGQVVISVNENSQEMTVTLDGQQQYVWPVSTGLSRYATPSGTYKAFRMEKDHFSVEWDDAPMPHSIFFTPLGHAIHGTEHVDHLGRPASHGCVRLSQENAATLYALVQEAGLPNTTVIVNGSANADNAVSAKPQKRLAKNPTKPQRIREPEQQVVEEIPQQLIEEPQQLEPQQLMSEEPDEQLMVEEPDEQLMVEEPEEMSQEPEQKLVENPQSRRLRRSDDPFVDSYN